MTDLPTIAPQRNDASEVSQPIKPSVTRRCPCGNIFEAKASETDFAVAHAANVPIGEAQRTAVILTA